MTILPIDAFDVRLRVCTVFSFSFFIALPYVRLIIAKASPGLPRLLLCLPLIVVQTAAPAMFNMHGEILARVVIMFVFSWLSNFKLIAYSMGRGPLAGTWSTAQTAAILYQPIYPLTQQDKKVAPTGRLNDDAGDPTSLLFRFLAKIAVWIVAVHLLLSTDLSPTVETFVLSLGLYSFVGVLMDGPGSVITHFLGFNIIPTFDAPWLSVSLSDFWGRRWNITTSHLLRAVVYDPIMEGSWVKQAGAKKMLQPAARLTRLYIGLCATFFTSGVVHELIFWANMPDGVLRWKWLVFFSMQGPLMMLEYTVVRWCTKHGWLLSPWAARPLVFSFMLLTGQHLFFSPCMQDTDLGERTMKACQVTFLAILDAVKHPFI